MDRKIDGLDEVVDCLYPGSLKWTRETIQNVHRSGMLHRGCHIVLVNYELELLLQRRSAHKMINPSRWTSSVSAHVSAGESFDCAARREMKEELGIGEHCRIDVVGDVYARAQSNDGSYVCKAITRVFLAREKWTMEHFTCNPEEIDALEFASLWDIEPILFETQTVVRESSWIRICRQLQARLLAGPATLAVVWRCKQQLKGSTMKICEPRSFSRGLVGAKGAQPGLFGSLSHSPYM